MGGPLQRLGIACLRDGHTTWEEFVQDFPTCFMAFDPDILFYGNEIYSVLCNMKVVEDIPCAYFDPAETPPLPAFCEFDSPRILEFENLKLTNDDYLGFYGNSHKPVNGRVSRFRLSLRLPRFRITGRETHSSVVVLAYPSHADNSTEVRVGLYSFTKENEKELGSGSYGTVYPGTHRQNGSRVAIKVVDSKDGEKTKKQMFAELQALKKWTGRDAKPNLLLMVDSYYLDGTMYLVTELCNPGDLERYLKKNDIAFVLSGTVVHLAKQLAAAMVELDRLGIMHRDIKPSNIMLHDTMRMGQTAPWKELDTFNPLALTVKLADFGFSKILAKTARGTARTQAGSKAYMAPEIVMENGKKKYDARADMFSIGVVLYECMENKHPFPDYWHETGDKSLDGLYSSGNTDSKISFRQPLHGAPLRNLVKALMRYDPKQRMTVHELADHELLQVQDESFRHGYIKEEQLIYQIEPGFGRSAKLGQRYSQYKGCLLNNQVPSPPMRTLVKQTRLSDCQCTKEWFLHETAEDRLKALVPDKTRIQAYKFDMLAERMPHMEHGYGAYLTDHDLRGRTCVTLIFRLDYQAIQKKFSRSCMSTTDARLYEMHRNDISCRMYSNIQLEKPEHTEGIEAEVDAWMFVLNRLATEADYTANVMSRTRTKGTTASQIWFEIVPVKNVVKQSPEATSIRRTIFTVPERCWNVVESMLAIYENYDEWNQLYQTVWQRHGCFVHVPQSIRKAAADTVSKIDGDIRDFRRQAASVICKTRMGRGDWSTALELSKKAFKTKGSIPFRSTHSNEYDPRDKLRHCLNVLEAMQDSSVEFIKIADLKSTRWRRYHCFIAVFDWNLVEKAPNAGRDVLCCICRLAELGHNCGFIDITDLVGVKILKDANVGRRRSLVRTEVLAAGINVMEPVDKKQLQFERYPVFVAFYDSFLAEVYPEATEAVLENIKRLKTEGLEVVFVDTAVR